MAEQRRGTWWYWDSRRGGDGDRQGGSWAVTGLGRGGAVLGRDRVSPGGGAVPGRGEGGTGPGQCQSRGASLAITSWRRDPISAAAV